MSVQQPLALDAGKGTGLGQSRFAGHPKAINP
jgi:hypothetical protein